MCVFQYIYEQFGWNEKPGWVAISICFGIALLICMAIHPYCVLFCLGCSVPYIIYFHQAALLVLPSRKPARID
jgi:hypothetical protein